MKVARLAVALALLATTLVQGMPLDASVYPDSSISADVAVAVDASSLTDTDTVAAAGTPLTASLTDSGEQPAPAAPSSVDPAAVVSVETVAVASVDPAPVDLTPVDPAPVDPSPVDLTPVEPAPVDPVPNAPVPEPAQVVDPAPPATVDQSSVPDETFAPAPVDNSNPTYPYQPNPNPTDLYPVDQVYTGQQPAPAPVDNSQAAGNVEAGQGAPEPQVLLPVPSPFVTAGGNEPQVYYNVRPQMPVPVPLPGQVDWASLEGKVPGIQSLVSTSLNTQYVPGMAVESLFRPPPVAQVQTMGQVVSTGLPIKQAIGVHKPQVQTLTTVQKPQTAAVGAQKQKPELVKNTAMPGSLQMFKGAKGKPVPPKTASVKATAAKVPPTNAAPGKPVPAIKGKSPPPLKQVAAVVNPIKGKTNAAVPQGKPVVVAKKPAIPAKAAASVATTVGKPAKGAPSKLKSG